MKIIALAMLLAVAQTSPPVQRQTANASASSSQHITKHTESNQSPTKAAPVIKNQESAQDQNKGRDPADANEKETIIIRECAPMPKAGTDWWYRAYVIFTGALVVIGSIGVGYAIKTLKAIQRQAKANEDQLTEIQQSAEKTDRMILIAAQEAENGRAAMNSAKMSADAAVLNAQASVLHAQAIVNSERPWMLIEIKPLPGTGAFTVGFRNCGRTPAEIVSFCQEIECRGTDGDFGLVAAPNYWDEQQILKYTRIVAPRQKWFNPGESTFWLEQNFIAEQWSDIKNSKKRAVYWGRLRYRDLIEIPKTVHQLNEVEAATLPASLHETCFATGGVQPSMTFCRAVP